MNYRKIRWMAIPLIVMFIVKSLLRYNDLKKGY